MTTQLCAAKAFVSSAFISITINERNQITFRFVRSAALSGQRGTRRCAKRKLGQDDAYCKFVLAVLVNLWG
jgi:hypothetical protein